MNERFIHFVVDADDNNRIIKITKQRKRAEDMMTKLNIHVFSYNPSFYPEVLEFKVGEFLNDFKIELERYRKKIRME